eukprot:scaffold34_cov124-Isochrysis_galbana.AAC.12
MKQAVRVLTVIWSRGVSSAPSAYSSGRGKLSRRGREPKTKNRLERCVPTPMSIDRNKSEPSVALRKDAALAQAQVRRVSHDAGRRRIYGIVACGAAPRFSKKSPLRSLKVCMIYDVPRPRSRICRRAVCGTSTVRGVLVPFSNSRLADKLYCDDETAKSDER